MALLVFTEDDGGGKDEVWIGGGVMGFQGVRSAATTAAEGLRWLEVRGRDEGCCCCCW